MGRKREEQEIASIVNENERSPYSCKTSEAWLKRKKNEGKRLRSLLNNFGERPFII